MNIECPNCKRASLIIAKESGITECHCMFCGKDFKLKEDNTK